MGQAPLFQDPDRNTALTIRVYYDGFSGMVAVASAMHDRDETPRSLAVIANVSTEQHGWWAVHNKVREEIGTYAIMEDARTRGTSPF